MIAVLAVAVPLVLAALAIERWAQVRHIRRQTLDVLSVVPELAGVATTGEAERTAATAAAVSKRLGLGRHEVRQAAAAGRLRGLAELGAAAEGVAQARLVSQITTESGLSPSVTRLVNEVLTTSGDRAGKAAAAVRVAVTFERKRTEPHVTTAGALFGTVAAHGAGNDRQAAAALVSLMQVPLRSA